MSSVITKHKAKDRSFALICLLVFAAHACVIGLAIFTAPSAQMIDPQVNRLVVQTIALAPAVEKMEVAEVNESVSAPAVLEAPKPPPAQPPIKKLPQPQPIKKTVQPPPAPIKKVSPPPKVAPKPAAPPKQPPKPALPPPPAKPQPTKAPPPTKLPTPTKVPAKIQAPPQTYPPPHKQSSSSPSMSGYAANDEEKKKREADEKALLAKQLAEEKAHIAELQRKTALIGQVKNNIEKVAAAKGGAKTAAGSSLSKVAAPTAITSLHIDAMPGQTAAFSSKELGYKEELAARLKLLLKLPEYGEVKIKLTLQRSGKVAKVNVLASESDLNRGHIEKTLPNLTFPPFGSNFENADEYAFTITLSNEL
jgi:colicin import membrane protein